jgi:hypothetical protein
VIVSGFDDARFSLLLECREGKEPWHELGDVRAWKPDFRTPSISVEPKSTYAIYGFVLSKQDQMSRVFDHAGDFDIRLRMHCSLGEFATDTVVIRVAERPKREIEFLAADGGRHAARYQAFSQLLNLEAEFPEEFDPLRKELHAGALYKSVELEARLATYLQKGTVDDKPLTFEGAFRKLAMGMDEVRRDHAAFVLAREAVKRDKLGDASAIFAELKDDGQMRANLIFSFKNKLGRSLTPPKQ